MRRIPLFSLLLLALTATPARSQDLGTQISALTAANAELFVGPLALGLGHAMTAGFVSSADPHRLLGFDLGIRFAGAQFPMGDETFKVVLPNTVTFGGRTYTDPYEATNGGMSPTVAGQGAGVQLKPRVGSAYRSDILLAGKNPDSKDFVIGLPAGLDFPGAPFAVIDGALGIGFGTQIMARVMPTIDVGKLAGVDEIGDVSAFGWGVMTNLTQLLPIATPFWDVSIVLGSQKLDLGNYAHATGKTLGLVGSVGFGPLTFYTHGSAYRADVDVDYTVANPQNNPGLPANGTHIAFRSSVPSTKRLAVGAQLNLVMLKFSAEYGMGSYKTFSAKAGIGLN